MAISHTLLILDVAKAVAKTIPLVGTSLEAVVELLVQGCEAAQVSCCSR
jgi:hypothetical protein